MEEEQVEKENNPELLSDTSTDNSMHINFSTDNYDNGLAKSTLEIGVKGEVFSLTAVLSNAVKEGLTDDGSSVIETSFTMSAYNAAIDEYVEATYKISMQFSAAGEPMPLSLFHSNFIGEINENGSETAQGIYNAVEIDLLANLVNVYPDISTTYSNIEQALENLENVKEGELSEFSSTQDGFVNFVVTYAMLGLAANPETLSIMYNDKEATINQFKSFLTNSFMENSMQEVIDFVENHPKDAQAIVGEDKNLQQFIGLADAETQAQAINKTMALIETYPSADLIHLDAESIIASKVIA